MLERTVETGCIWHAIPELWYHGNDNSTVEGLFHDIHLISSAPHIHTAHADVGKEPADREEE